MASRRMNGSALTLLLIILLAVALRFWHLDRLPPGLYHDEAYNGLDALSLLQGKSFPQYYEGWELYAQDAHANRPATPTRYPVFFEGNYGREPLHVYLMAISLWLLGVTPFAVRAVPAAAGVLAVLTTFLAARAVFPPQTGRIFNGELLPLLSAFSVAVLYPAIHFSRFGIRAMVMLPFVTLAVYAFWRGWRQPDYRRGDVWLAIAGVFVGLSLYTFAAARLFPLVFVIFGFYLFWRDRQTLLRRWRGLVLALVAALLIAAPLLLFFARYPYFFIFRMAYVANRGRGVVDDAPILTWLFNSGRVIRGFFWLGETHLRHNLPGRPFMDPLQGVLFLVGVSQTVRHRARPEHIFLLIWLAIMLLPSILSGDAPHFGRLTGALPAVAILIAAGGSWVIEKIASLTNRPIWVAVTIAALTIPSLSITTYDYFIRYAGHPDLARDFYLDDWMMGRSAATQSPDTVLYLTPAQEEMATIFFALADPDRLRSFNGQEGMVPAGIPGQPIFYLVRPNASQTLANLIDYFGEGAAITGEQYDGFIPVHVPAEAERVLNPIADPVDLGGEIHLPGWSYSVFPDHLEVSLTWQAITTPAEDYTAFVHLVNRGGELVAQTDRQPAGFPTGEWRPGEIVSDNFRVDLPAGLPPGEYELQTGLYYLPTLERLGEAVILDTVEISGTAP
jgi:4-amino-4-deoxy-L-arabinose transferase-like glycosyltransferase